MKYPNLVEQGIPFFVYPRKDAKNVFYYRFVFGDENHHKSTKKLTQIEAELMARRAIQQAIAKHRAKAPPTAPTSRYLAATLAGYHETTKGALRPSTAVYRARFWRWLSEAFPTLEINEISIPLMHNFLNELKVKLDPSASYWRDIISRYNQLFEWAILTNKCAINPLLGYPRPKVKEYTVEDETWEDWEYAKVFQALSPEDAHVIMVLRYSGIYPKDYAFLEKGHFVLLDGVLTLVKQRAKNTEVYKQPIDGRIEPALKQRWLQLRSPKERMFVKVTEEGYRNWLQNLQRHVTEAWRMVIRESSPKMLKSLRHTFLTEAIERGVPEDVLLKWAGHAEGSTVLRRHYLHRKSTARYRYVEASDSPIARSSV